MRCSSDDSAAERAALVEQGKQIFRFDTFGDEAQWTDVLRMHEVISAAVDPMTALSVGSSDQEVADLAQYLKSL